ncbi:hypothetical protein QG37_05268 [Candidozyma auris]|nr:hypothetical protein QG37_05268 [[Candida] auris]
MNHLETVNFDILLWQSQLGDQELRHFNSSVTLHSNNLTQLGILNDVAVTGKILLQNL